MKMGIFVTFVPLQQDATKVLVVNPVNTTLLNTEPIEKGRFYILIPLGFLLGIVITFILVFLMTRKRRYLVHMYCRKRTDIRFMYKNEWDSPLEQDPDAVEEEDEVDNENNPTKCLLGGKLEINSRYESYLSTSHLNKSSGLFT